MMEEAPHRPASRRALRWLKSTSKRTFVIYPIGMKGRKKLQDLFVDEKVPRDARPRALVLEAGGHVAWVVGLRIDRRFAATEETREALELRVEET